MRFEWSEEKDRSNLRKHEISFATATRVFEDPNYVMVQDREVVGEERWQTIGRIGDMTVLLVAHTVVDDEEDVIFRIISARRATARERRRYEANTH
ncbi:MAG: BrnT family toxin [Edaphobacter sp.]